MRKIKVGIVGAGPAGLVSAIAGAKLGMEVTVFEKVPEFRPAGAGFGIQSNGLRVLEALDLLDSFLPKLRLCQKYILTLSGETDLHYNFGELPIPHNHFAVALRFELQEHLLLHAEKVGVKVRFGHRCTGAEIHNGKAVIKFDSGNEEEFDIVVACDGIHSAIRTKLNVKTKELEVGQSYLRGVVPIQFEEDVFREIWGNDGRIFGICPLPEGRTFFFCSAPNEKWEEIRNNRLNEWIEGWKGHGEKVMSILKAVEDWNLVNYDNRLKEIQMKPWYYGPVFFAGDSAHAMRPNYGQGANSAMVDGLVLMKLIAEVIGSGGRHEDAGKRYDSIRRPFVSRIQQGARMAGIMSGWTSAPARKFRDLTFRIHKVIKPLSKQNLLLASGFNPKEERFFQPLAPAVQ